MSLAFPIVKPFLVKSLSDIVRVKARAHGCSFQIYPNRAYPFGHMVTFPPGTEMQIVNSTYSYLHFPDGYSCTLIWRNGAYYWDEEMPRRVSHPVSS